MKRYLTLPAYLIGASRLRVGNTRALDESASVNEKIVLKRLWDRDKRLSQYADKYLVRTIVERAVGTRYLTRLIAVTHLADELDLNSLPERCVLKPTHGSGAVLILDPEAPPSREIPSVSPIWPWGFFVRMRKEDVHEASFKRLWSRILRSNYGLVKREFAYRAARPGIIVEELLEPGQPAPPDYKFWCLNGRVVCIQVDMNRETRHMRSIHLPDWQVLPVRIKYSRPDVPPARPRDLDEMLDVASNISQPLDFARIDLYSTSNGIKFGEVTHYPGGGLEQMEPEGIMTDLFRSWTPRYPR